MKSGLIMEGGGMRGMFTAGVIDHLMGNGVEFDGAIGVSAGAAFGCNYKSKQPGRGARYNLKYINDPRYCGIKVLLKTGNMFSTEFCYRDIPLKYDIFDFDAYENNPMEFYVVATDVETGEAVYHKYTGRDDACFDWIRASASLPLVSQFVEINGQKLLDGGIADSIPLKYFESIGYDRCVLILTQPADYVKGKNRMLPIAKLKYRKYPNLVRTMRDRHLIYNEATAYVKERQAEGSVFVIRPKEALDLSRLEKDPEKLRLAYALGKSAAEEKLSALRTFLSE